MFKKFSITIVLMITLSLIPCGQSSEGKLIVKVEGFDNNDGDVKVALFNSFESFTGKAPLCRSTVSMIENEKSLIEFDSLAFGEYAIRLFHDENVNDTLDTNFIGLPSEDYGFSNNPSTMFGYPSYEDVKFIFEKDNQQIVIEVD